MTERLYYLDSHIKSFEARVLACEEKKGAFEVILDKTAFFPEGGGQLGDVGFIGGVRVTDTRERSEDVVHFCESPLTVGETVKCELDWDIRFCRMQNHSGEHIISGIVHAMFGYDNVGFHMGSEDITVDYNGYIEPQDLRKIEARANRAVCENLDIRADFPSAEELETLFYRSKLELTENVRIVTVGDGLDVCACCAPHVKKTGEIGIIKLLDAIHYKGGIRIHLLCGFDALRDYHKRYEQVKTLANSLSVKQDEACEAVERRLDEFAQLRFKYTKLKNELLDSKIAAIAPTEGNVCIFEDEGDYELLRKLADAVADRCGGICAVFGDNGHGYNYVMVSRHVDLRAASKQINSALSGRGGGSPAMIQGMASCDRETAEKYFSEV
ncbi:MAG: hypothetical protein IJX46_00765 [Clostridia bacterium]|nr:hypothetical protein [Clostridia bacterium]